ncbi:hypothetical protein ANO11243_075550 [Dothideomycetidae sp. 11243]|nr:hypothetical protein ANO11243_075550 [fungal sp. No.11243]
MAPVVLTVTIAVAVEDRPASAPQMGSWKPDWHVVASPSFTEAMSAISSLLFAYAGAPVFLPIISEMKDGRLYPRCMFLTQTCVTLMYTVIGVVVYLYCGSFVESPALGSAGPVMKRVCYGLALPGFLFTTVMFTHQQLPAKYFFVRILRGTKHIASNTKTHWVTWLGSVFATALTAYIIASAIPVFGKLVSLVGALFSGLLTFITMGCMWLYDNWKVEPYRRTLRWRAGVVLSVSMILLGVFLTVAGTYGAVMGIIDDYKANGGSAAWSCADNAGAE